MGARTAAKPDADVDRRGRSRLLGTMEKSQKTRDRQPVVAAAPAPAAKPLLPTGPREMGWLPDCVYTAEKFETGLAFFADALGRIVRFSREPADLAVAHRLAGQAALPGLVNAHSHAVERVMRGRGGWNGRTERDAFSTWRAAADGVLGRLTAEQVYDTARMAFVEMLLSGITVVGEMHYLHHQPDGMPRPEPNFLSHEVLRAAHDVGIRIALLKVAGGRGGHPRALVPAADTFVREADALRMFVEKNHPADEAWTGVAVQGLHTVPRDYLKAIGAYAHAQRLRLHVQLSERLDDNGACVGEHGRTPLAALAEQGLIDKRFTAVGAIQVTDDEIKLLGTARATVCVCPTSARAHGLSAAPAEKFLAAGVTLALGTDSQTQIDLLEEARLLESSVRANHAQRGAPATDVVAPLFHAATVAGARSLGATGGALEVGRPADFFTVSLLDPSLAGAEPGALLGNVMFSPGRAAVREVWVGARQLVVNGRHAAQGAIAGKFVELQRRLWTS